MSYSATYQNITAAANTQACNSTVQSSTLICQKGQKVSAVFSVTFLLDLLALLPACICMYEPSNHEQYAQKHTPGANLLVLHTLPATKISLRRMAFFAAVIVPKC